MMRKLSLRLIVALVALALAATLGAQTGPTADGDTGLFSLTTADTLPAGEWSAGWYVQNWDRFAAESPRPGPFREYETLVYDRTEMSFSLGYGVTDRFELAFSVPWAKLDESSDMTIGYIDGLRVVDEVDEAGIAPIRLRAKWALWDSASTSSRFSLFGGVDVPTTSKNIDDPIQTGAWDYLLGGSITSRYLTFSIGYTWRGDRYDIDVPSELQAGFGFHVPASSHVDFIGEFMHTAYEDLGDNPFTDASPKDQTDAAMGVRYFVNNVVALNAGLRLNLTLALSGEDGNGHSPLGWVAGITYYPWTKGRRKTVIEGYGWEKPAPPAPPVITVPADGATVTTATPAIAGTGVPGASVKVSLDGSTLAPVPVDAAGTWRTTGGPIAPGSHAAVATQTDGKTGLTSGPSNSVRFNYEKPVDVKPPVIAEKKPETVMMDTIQFDAGSAKLTNIAKAILDQAALRIKADDTATAVVVGHCDARGSEKARQEMSEKRAAAARDYLVERHGIAASRIQTMGKGSTEPEGDDKTKEGRAKNRRAVITVTVMK